MKYEQTSEVRNKPHVVYGPDGERLGVYHIKSEGGAYRAIIRKAEPRASVFPNSDPRRRGTFVAQDTEPFTRFR